MIYVVYTGYVYEGDDIAWAGSDFESAMTFADSIEGFDHVSVMLMTPLPTATWSREGWRTTVRPTLTYQHRELMRGSFVLVGSLVR